MILRVAEEIAFLPGVTLKIVELTSAVACLDVLPTPRSPHSQGNDSIGPIVRVKLAYHTSPLCCAVALEDGRKTHSLKTSRHVYARYLEKRWSNIGRADEAIDAAPASVSLRWFNNQRDFYELITHHRALQEKAMAA